MIQAIKASCLLVCRGQDNIQPGSELGQAELNVAT